MNRLVIISRYNEPVEWVKKLKCDYIIFNKGDKLNDTEIPQEKIIELENWGRESETFLRYICQNYDKLADETIFLQANPFDHFPETIDYINSELKYNELVGLGPSTECDLSGFPSYPNLPLSTVINPMIPKFSLEKIPFTAGAQWVVNKKFIHNKTHRWWRSLYGLFSFYWFSETPSGFGKKNGEFVGHIMERLWFIIFSHESEERYKF